MSIKTNIADYLTQIEMLTNTNLQILKTINDSFFTKQSHIITEINDTKYVIPSFISLENKINMLQENFENLTEYCSKIISKEHFKGMLQTTWTMVTEEWWEPLKLAADLLAETRKSFENK